MSAINIPSDSLKQNVLASVLAESVCKTRAGRKLQAQFNFADTLLPFEKLSLLNDFCFFALESATCLWYIYYIVLQAHATISKSPAKCAMMTDSLGFRHKSGILTAVSSLPSEWGIGTFGAPCKRFVDFLSATRTKCWQILPLNPTAYGDSPYQSPASFAGNHYYIDPQTLFEKGLLDDDDLKSARHICDKTDYGWLFENKTTLLKKAYARFKTDSDFSSFCNENAEWLDDYAYFMSLKATFGYRAWSEWPDEFRIYSTAQAHKADFADEIAFWKFVQYEFLPSGKTCWLMHIRKT